MPPKTPAQLAFELDTITWGMDFAQDDMGNYVEFATGSMFGSYLMGWEAAMGAKCAS